MKNNLYDLMDWPEIEGIVYSECDKPYSWLGSHLCKAGLLIQAFRPDAVEMSVQVEGRKKSYIMEKVDEAGFFAVVIPVKKYLSYTLTIEYINGKKETYVDPYYFGEQLSLEDKKSFAAGTCDNAYEFMGSHFDVVDDIEGMRFAVWAPSAKRVSVTGEFNNWDGRIFQMQKDDEFGIFELFIPGIKPGTPYVYEVKYRDGRIAKKNDVYSKAVKYTGAYSSDSDLYTTDFDGYVSLADVNSESKWTDAEWYKNKKVAAKTTDKPLSICELDMSLYVNEAKNIVKDISELGFNYVKLISVCAAADDSDKPQTTGYFALNPAIDEGDFKKLVNEFHNNNIGVIMDWHAAYMGSADYGMAYYDGTPLYEMGIVRLDNHKDISAATFDYSKPQVCSLLYSSFKYWVEVYHIDGVVIDETASMLYLDYGRYAGEWTPNMYGGNENGYAVSFLQGLCKLADKSDRLPILISQDESAWPLSTGDIHKEGLGFDYKFNTSWKNESIRFMETDPLFRKGIYGRLTYSMLYQYSEEFMLDLSHMSNEWKNTSLYDKIPSVDNDLDADNRLRSLLLFMGYMYSYPGKKLVNYDEIKYCRQYMAELNKFYFKNKALYEQDSLTDGFEWVDDVSAEETVLSYMRRAADGTELIAVMNFTPVSRQEFTIGVKNPGKYTEVFNSEAFMQNIYKESELTVPDTDCVKVYKSDMQPWNGRENSIKTQLPPLGFVIYSYEPYTPLELKEIEIRREAVIAKAKALEEAKVAQELKSIADERAKAAKEAEVLAKKAANEAVKAAKEAEKRAEKAERASLKIEEETKKKLEALYTEDKV